MSTSPTPSGVPPADGAAPDDLFEVLLAPEVLEADEVEALRAALRADPALAARARAFDDAEARLRGDMEASLPSRDVLVLLALEASGRGATLSEDDAARLDAARPALAQLCAAMPALENVKQRVADDAEVFEQCWMEAWRERRASPRPAVARTSRARPLWRVGVALAVVAFAAVSVLVLQRDRGLVTVTASTPGVVTLADGTTVRLASGARLTYPDPARSSVLPRTVKLSGDAFFDVTSAAERFQVQTAAARIAVLGTVFGVRASKARTEVTLVEGALAIQAGGATVRLAPGEQSQALRGAAPSSPSVVDVSRALAWSGLHVFRNTPLGDALAQLAERHGVALTTTEALRAQQVSGTFEATQPLAEILDSIALALGVHVERTEGGYRIG